MIHKKVKGMELRFYSVLRVLLTVTSMVCVIGMTIISFHTWWSKIFVWSIVSSSIIDTILKGFHRKVKGDNQ